MRIWLITSLLAAFVASSGCVVKAHPRHNHPYHHHRHFTVEAE